MLTIIPPKSTGDIYIGVASGYKPAKVITINGIESMRYNHIDENNDDFYTCYLGGTTTGTKVKCEKPIITITSNGDISNWDTDADIVIDNSTGKTYCTDKAKKTYTQITE